MSCIICNNSCEVTSNNREFQEETFSDRRNLLETNNLILFNFCDYFNIKLPLATVKWDLEQEDLPFCIICKQIAENLVELNQKIKFLREELNETERLVRSKIKSICSDSGENISKTWASPDARINTVRDLILGPRVEITKIPLTSAKKMCNISIKTDPALTDEGDGDLSYEENSTPESPDSYADEMVDGRKRGKKSEQNSARRSARSRRNKGGESAFGSIFEIEEEMEGSVKKEFETSNDWSESFPDGFDDDSRDSDFILPDDSVETLIVEEKLEAKVSETLRKRIKKEKSEGGKKVVTDLGGDKYRYKGLEFTGNTKDGFKCSECSDSNWIFWKRKQVLAHMKARHLTVDGYLKDKSEVIKKPYPLPNLVTVLGGDKYRYRGLEFTGNTKDGFKCSECNSNWIFLKRRQILIHMKSNHLAARGCFPCPTCKAVCPTAKGLIAHQRRHKLPQEATCVCELCGKGYKGEQALKVHILFVHQKEAEEPCEICGKKFKTKTVVKNHIASVHLNRISCFCEICGKGFKSKSGIRIHIASTHGEEPAYACELCGQRFRQKGGYIRHKRLFHSEAGKRNVPHAAMGVAESADKNVNEEGSGDLNLRCKYCGLQYNRQNNLTRHLLQIHHINVKGLSWKRGAPSKVLAKVTPQSESYFKNPGVCEDENHLEEIQPHSTSNPPVHVTNQVGGNKLVYPAVLGPGPTNPWHYSFS